MSEWVKRWNANRSCAIMCKTVVKGCVDTFLFKVFSGRMWLYIAWKWDTYITHILDSSVGGWLGLIFAPLLWNWSQMCTDRHNMEKHFMRLYPGRNVRYNAFLPLTIFGTLSLSLSTNSLVVMRWKGLTDRQTVTFLHLSLTLSIWLLGAKWENSEAQSDRWGNP